MDMIQIESLLGAKTLDKLMDYTPSVHKDKIFHHPTQRMEEIYLKSDRSQLVLNNLERMFSSGRLGGTGYLSILPVDQGIEHSAGASFSPNVDFFDPEMIIKLALESGCNAVASTYGVLGLYARKYAHKIPFLVKINHNQLLSYPNQHDQVLFGSVDEAYNMGAAAVGATIYFGSPESNRQITEISHAFAYAHELGMATVLWCYLRNPAFKVGDTDYHLAADLTAQACHIGCTIQADIIKQKLPTCNGGFNALKFGKTDPRCYTELCKDHPIDYTRYQVLNCYSGKIPLINSGGASTKNEKEDFSEAIYTAIVNKRAGGGGLIMGRKAFQKPFKDGVKLIQSVQDVYLDPKITIA